MRDFAVYYIETNILCVIIFLILLLHNHFNIDRQEKQIKFDRVLLVFILYFLVDCFWAAMLDGFIPRNRISMVVVSFLIYFVIAATIYCWLQYVMAYEQVPHRNRPINRFAVLFPYLVSTVALILHYLIAPQSLLDGELKSRPVFNVYLATVPFIYLAAVLFYTIRKARAEESRSEKRKHLFVGFFPLIVIVGGLIQVTLLPKVPIYCSTALILMLVFYIQSIDVRISADPLTQLNNRGQLTRYTAQKSNLYMDDRLTVVIMMDIDSFKTINDSYGHAEGDRALVIVADSLKAVVNRHNTPSFLCRYGGDEFILITHPASLEETDVLIREIREEIQAMMRESPYPLSVSVGYEELLSGQDSIQSCIQRADRKLYSDKESRKRSGKARIS